MYMTRTAMYRLPIVILFALIFVCATVKSVAAQTTSTNDACTTATGEYASWLDKLESLRGTLTVSGNDSSSNSEVSVNVTFAIVNTGVPERLDYFIQAQNVQKRESEISTDHIIFFAKDNLAAGLDIGRGWDVAPREEAYDLQGIEEIFFRADDFLKTAFKDLRLLELSVCLGSEIIAGRETIHYRLDIPPMLARMLLSQLQGNSPDDIAFDEVGFDFWLDQTDGYMVKIEGNVNVSNPNGPEAISAEATLELTSINNVQLKVPEYIRILAMQRGLIEPDFTQEFITVDE